MGSDTLNKGIALASDIMTMRGPITKREVAEEVLRSCRPDTWAETERREAYVMYAIKNVHHYFNSSVSAEISTDILDAIPHEYRKHFNALPRMICVSAHGGAGAQHVNSLLATAKDWQRNFELKDFIAQKIWSGRNVSRDIRNLLMSLNVNCLADLEKHIDNMDAE